MLDLLDKIDAWKE